MAFSPLNSGYSPLNAVTAALPLNILAGDLKPCVTCCTVLLDEEEMLICNLDDESFLGTG